MFLAVGDMIDDNLNYQHELKLSTWIKIINMNYFFNRWEQILLHLLFFDWYLGQIMTR